MAFQSVSDDFILRFGLVLFYDISTIVGYLIPNSVYS